MSKVTLIVSQVYWLAREQTWRSSGASSVRQDFDTLASARRIGETKKAKGIGVIVRPNYNEKDENGCFFREWCSFDGEPFEEVRWEIDACFGEKAIQV